LSPVAQDIWSRRRAAVQAEKVADTKADRRARAAQAQSAMAGKSDDEILQALELKDPDQMQQGDDFTAFMLDEVPEHLRKRALRKLWRSNPVLACVDDLVDYGDDFKAEWDGVGLIKTVYQVGKGMLRDEEDAPVVPDDADDIEVAEAAAPEASPEQVTPVDPSMDAPVPTSLADHDQAEKDQAEIDQEWAQPRPRRMRFNFDEVS